MSAVLHDPRVTGSGLFALVECTGCGHAWPCPDYLRATDG